MLNASSSDSTLASGTTAQWPIRHGVLCGVNRDHLMRRHKAIHIELAYGENEHSSDRTLLLRAAMAESLGIRVRPLWNSERWDLVAQY